MAEYSKAELIAIAYKRGQISGENFFKAICKLPCFANGFLFPGWGHEDGGKNCNKGRQSANLPILIGANDGEYSSVPNSDLIIPKVCLRCNGFEPAVNELSNS